MAPADVPSLSGAARVVRGLVLPATVSGNPALELCNTRAGWGGPDPKEYLQSYQHLVVLAADQALISARAGRQCLGLAATDPSAADSVLRRTHRLRGDLYRVLAGDHEPALLARVNADLLRGRRGLSLTGVDEQRRASWSAGPVRLSTPLDAFARAAEDLLASGSTSVSACPGHGCGWLFDDPAGRRTWCSMRWCGNRAKVARHAARLSLRRPTPS